MMKLETLGAKPLASHVEKDRPRKNQNHNRRSLSGSIPPDVTDRDFSLKRR